MTLSPIVITVLSLSLCLGVCIICIALWSRHRKAGKGALNLMGMQALVSAALEPEGAIILDGELWRARARQSTPTLLPGHTVRVVGVDGHFLLVEPT